MLKSLRHLYWIAKGFVARHGQLILQMMVVVIAVIGVFFLFERYLPTPKSTTRIGRVGKFSLDTLPADIKGQISLGLVTVHEDGTIEPGIASSWAVSPDGKTYTFTLNTSLRWQDGAAVRPQDISYNFQDVVSSVGKGSITYTLSESYAPFLNAVSTPILKKGTIGTGEYRIAGMEQFNDTIQTLAIENATVKKMYKFYPTEQSVITAYQLGEIDRIEDLTSAPAELAGDTSSVITHTPNANGAMAVLYFNNNDSILAQKSTRQALAYAISDKTFGHTRAISPIAATSWAYNPLVKTYDFDAAHAKNLLSENVKTPGTVTIELKTTLPYLADAEAIAKDWQNNLGLQVNVKVISGVTTDYQALLADFTPPADPDQYTMWHSTQSTNFTHLTDLKIDKLLEDGRRTLDQNLRKSTYEDFQRFLLEDCPAVFLFNTDSYAISRKPLI